MQYLVLELVKQHFLDANADRPEITGRMALAEFPRPEKPVALAEEAAGT
jgi:hypothetical protein